ncbi:MAG: M55 family metallopeptidase [Rhodothermales bacterium]|nr:M55 family metallopeptidase [Rhodothermales bacterium]
MKRSSFVFLAVALAVAASVPGASAQDGLKIYISADMEGVAGAVTGEQLGPSGFEYQRFRQFMTDEVNAAIEAAFAAGATEILVSDSHGNGQNLLIDQLPENVRVIRSWPRPLGMMAGIDASFDGVIYIGYHTSTTNTEGVRAHTMSSARLTAVKLNGVPVSEAAFNAAIAGHFGVPVIMVSGDDAIIEETRQIVGDVEGAIVKRALGFHSAETMTPVAANHVIRDGVTAAVRRIDDFRPYQLKGPVELEVSMKNYRPVELLGYLPNVDRVDSHTIRFVAKDMTEASGFMTFILSYNADLAP